MRYQIIETKQAREDINEENGYTRKCVYPFFILIHYIRCSNCRRKY